MPVLAAPVLIERELLLEEDGEHINALAMEAMVAFQRRGKRVLLVSARPSGWRPTRRSVDKDLTLQRKLHQLFMRGGAELDGVVYLTTGLFGRKQRHKDEIEQIAKRYACNVDQMIFIGADPSLISLAETAGMKRCCIEALPAEEGGSSPDLPAALNTL